MAGNWKDKKLEALGQVRDVIKDEFNLHDEEDYCDHQLEEISAKHLRAIDLVSRNLGDDDDMKEARNFLRWLLTILTEHHRSRSVDLVLNLPESA